MSSNITTFKPGAPLAKPVGPVIESAEMVAFVAAELPPKLAAGASLADWLERTERSIGKHPRAVLAEAAESITSVFKFPPTKAEMVDHILDAYQRLGVALSDDAKRHLSYRKKMPARYTLNNDGIKRFADDAKVTLVGFFTVQGPQANIILDRLNSEGCDARIEDVEKAIGPVVKAFDGREKVSGDEVLERFRSETIVQTAYRLHGDPAQQCGGTVGAVARRSKMLPLTSTWLAVSEAFTNSMRDAYPFARLRDDPHSWANAMKEAFLNAVRVADHAKYGIGLQQESEALIQRTMADFNVTGRSEIARALKFQSRATPTNIAVIEVAEGRLRAGETVGTVITIDEESIMLDSLDNCAVARRKVETFAAKIEAGIKEVGQ